MSASNTSRINRSQNERNTGSTEKDDEDQVSSTSLDKRDDITNGTISTQSSTHSTRMDKQNQNNAQTASSNYVPSGDHSKDESAAIYSEDDEDNDLKNFVIPERTLPSYNCPEKIIIVYDCAIDEISTNFSLNNETVCPATMLKRSLRFFLYNKQLIDPRHEYALIAMNDNNVSWVVDFTSHIEVVINALDEIPACETEDILVLDDLFKLLSKKVTLPEKMENFNIPPPFVLRVLFTYGRSFTMPRIDKNLECVKEFVNSPYFTFDILMTHEMPCATNNCIKIFKDLQLIDCKGFAYFFPVGRSAAQLHLSMAKLLGHPLQRAVQRCADYTIHIMEV